MWPLLSCASEAINHTVPVLDWQRLCRAALCGMHRHDDQFGDVLPGAE
jgi:hypothetical protein